LSNGFERRYSHHRQRGPQGEALGDAAQARTEYERVLPSLQAEVDNDLGLNAWENARQLSLLARAYAGVGRQEEALREARRAAGLVPISKEPMLGSTEEIALAEIEARVGETNAAIERIRHLLSIPSLLSPGLLRIDPRWIPLHADARFRKLAKLDGE